MGRVHFIGGIPMAFSPLRYAKATGALCVKRRRSFPNDG